MLPQAWEHLKNLNDPTMLANLKLLQKWLVPPFSVESFATFFGRRRLDKIIRACAGLELTPIFIDKEIRLIPITHFNDLFALGLSEIEPGPNGIPQFVSQNAADQIAITASLEHNMVPVIPINQEALANTKYHGIATLNELLPIILRDTKSTNIRLALFYGISTVAAPSLFQIADALFSVHGPISYLYLFLTLGSAAISFFCAGAPAIYFAHMYAKKQNMMDILRKCLQGQNLTAEQLAAILMSECRGYESQIIQLSTKFEYPEEDTMRLSDRLEALVKRPELSQANSEPLQLPAKQEDK